MRERNSCLLYLKNMQTDRNFLKKLNLIRKERFNNILKFIIYFIIFIILYIFYLKMQEKYKLMSHFLGDDLLSNYL